MKLPMKVLFTKEKICERDPENMIRESDKDMKEYLENLESKNEYDDTEYADELLCQILEAIGYVLTVDKYREIKKKNKK